MQMSMFWTLDFTHIPLTQTDGTQRVQPTLKIVLASIMLSLPLVSKCIFLLYMPLLTSSAYANNTAGYSPKVPISTIRSEFPNAKVMIGRLQGSYLRARY